jgi:hypothetical protein
VASVVQARSWRTGAPCRALHRMRGLSSSATFGGAAGLWLSGGDVLRLEARGDLPDVEGHLLVLLEGAVVVRSRTVLE